MRKLWGLLWAIVVLSVVFASACNDPARPGNRRGKAISTALLCGCKPTHIAEDDWRIEYKNSRLPRLEPEETSVAAILAWQEGPEPGPRTARSGNELKMYRIRKAYVQTAFFRRSDCDLHLEISETPDKDAARMVVETPGASEYCAARTDVFSELRHRGITLTDFNQELSPPLAVVVEGVAFRDEAHPVWSARGSDKVATLWELHPAILKLLP